MCKKLAGGRADRGKGIQLGAKRQPKLKQVETPRSEQPAETTEPTRLSAGRIVVATSLIIYCTVVWGMVYMLGDWAMDQLSPPSVEARTPDE